MNIPKAIEILDLNLKTVGKRMPPDVRDAVQLSVEGLEAIVNWRDDGSDDELKQLPSETED